MSWRTVDRHFIDAPHGSNRDAPGASLDRQQDVPRPSPDTRERRYETLRKLGATSFSGTLDPAEAEAWLESLERIFNLM